jgi:hypothetical protein
VFVRVKRSGAGEGAREHLQIVESRREGGAVRRRVLATLGRREELVADGRLDGLLTSLAKFSERLRVIERVRTGGVEAHAARSWGPALVFERLWRKQGIDAEIARLSRGRSFEFDLERVVFLGFVVASDRGTRTSQARPEAVRDAVTAFSGAGHSPPDMEVRRHSLSRDDGVRQAANGTSRCATSTENLPETRGLCSVQEVSSRAG